MRLTCPGCGSTGTLEFFLMDAAARETVIAALNLPAPLGRQIMAYIGMFRPPKRGLSWDRVERILTDLLPPIQTASLERNGSTWPAPIDYWKSALDQIITKRDKLNLPLKSHGYLFEIVVGMSNKAEAVKEERREQSRGAGEGKRGGAPRSAGDLVKKITGADGAKMLRRGLMGGHNHD